MRRIYTSASEVLIWLGHDEPNISTASLELVCRIAGSQAVDQDSVPLTDIVKKLFEVSKSQYL